MRNIKLVIEYDGTDFHGWQKQPQLRTVQGEIDLAISKITGADPYTQASGRTDAGVHALGQVVNFLTSCQISTKALTRAMNAMLPRDVRVLSAQEAPETFHPSVHATSKRYRYQIDNCYSGNPFLRRTAWHQPKRLDVDLMYSAGQVLLGTHDFRSFETEWPNRASSVRTMYAVDVKRFGEMIQIELEADGFLYNMVRSIVGSLVLIGMGNREPRWLEDVLHALDRRKAGATAPPQGLFLLYVCYPEDSSQSIRSLTQSELPV